MKGIIIGWFLLILICAIGWVKDVIHLVHTDFRAPYKAEVIYGVGAVTGLGSIVGWINIEDGK